MHDHVRATALCLSSTLQQQKGAQYHDPKCEQRALDSLLLGLLWCEWPSTPWMVDSMCLKLHIARKQEREVQSWNARGQHRAMKAAHLQAEENYLLLFVVSLVLCSVATKNLLSKEEMKKGDIVGEEFNIPGTKSRGAVSYGIARTGGYAPSQFANANYIRPEMVSRLPDSIPPPPPGPKEEVNEIASVTNYYDGGAKLNKITITCKIYTTAQDCLTNSHCGWCGSSSGCVLGTNLGPLEPCVKSSYIFAAPTPKFNSQTRVINENIGGMTLTVVHK